MQLDGFNKLYEVQPSSADPVQIVSKPAYQLNENVRSVDTKQSKTTDGDKLEIVWFNVLLFIYIHTAGIIGLYHLYFDCMWKTFFFMYIVGISVSQGVTAGAHRLWAHKSYKAKLPLRILLCILQTMSLQNDIMEWSRDHRAHHKFTDTNADPHNINRGFFFAHMGWLMCRKHKDVKIKGKTIDMSDLENDPVVMFQKKYYLILAPLLTFIIPALIPWYFWNERFWVSWNTCAMARYILQLHGTWLVNSVAHMFGTRPYDKNIKPVESTLVSIAAFGEGWHNYHHTFPWDYKAAELGAHPLNLTTAFIDLFAKIGWAYDLKTTSTDMIMKRVKRTGDGTWKFQYCDDENDSGIDFKDNRGHVWGYDDADMKAYDKSFIQVIDKSG